MSWKGLRNMHNAMKKILWLISFLWFSCSVYSQTVGVKTNALYWATTTPNIGAEVALGSKTTLDLLLGYNPWNSGSKRLKHRLYQPEFRYWTCEAFNGHYFGVHAHYAYYNVGGVKLPFGVFKKLEDNRYQGRLYGAGISYGYQWILGNHWNLEAALGAGYTYFSYDKYQCVKCGGWKGKENKHFFGPTKASVSLIYILK